MKIVLVHSYRYKMCLAKGYIGDRFHGILYTKM